jgi:hypothetical protein
LHLRKKLGDIKRKKRPLQTRHLSRTDVKPKKQIPMPVQLEEKTTEVPGFDKGFNKGYDAGYDKGFRNGKYAGGDAIIDNYLPEYQILPDITVEKVIAAGVEHLRPYILNLIRADQLSGRIIQALDSRTPFSLIRLGDGELLTLAQETVLSMDRVEEEGAFLPYAGVRVPDLEVKSQLVKAIRGATVVGIPKLREANFQPLAFAVFRAEGIDFRSLTLTDSLINYHLTQMGYLSRITQGRRVLLIGNKAPELAGILSVHGVNVSGVISPVHGTSDIPRLKAGIAQHDFDIALVAAGVSAVVLAEWISREMRKVAIDLGHVADSILIGKTPYR